MSFEEHPRELARTVIEGAVPAAIGGLLAWMDAAAAGMSVRVVGHRAVHGGPAHMQARRVTPDLLDDLRKLIPFAPNHLPDEIALIEALVRHLPDTPQVVCFDTAFHRDLPDAVRRLPIPVQYDQQGIRRYGFHGLSCAYIAEELSRQSSGSGQHRRAIVAHLGNGSSVTALNDGRSVDTTMALTPISGIVMSTRSGDLDPGVVTYLA